MITLDEWLHSRVRVYEIAARYHRQHAISNRTSLWDKIARNWPTSKLEDLNHKRSISEMALPMERDFSDVKIYRCLLHALTIITSAYVFFVQLHAYILYVPLLPTIVVIYYHNNTRACISNTHTHRFPSIKSISNRSRDRLIYPQKPHPIYPPVRRCMNLKLRSTSIQYSPNEIDLFNQ